MRMAIVAAGLLTAAVPLAPAKAVTYHSWCSQSTSGTVSCSFDSREQCAEAVRGLVGICLQNPAPPPVETPASVEKDAAAAAALAASSKGVLVPGNTKVGADPDPAIRSYLQRDGLGASRQR